MAFKPVLEIDVKDAKFQQLLQSVSRLKERSKDVSEPFKKLDSRVKVADKRMESLGKHSVKHLSVTERVTKKVRDGLMGIGHAAKNSGHGIDHLTHKLRHFGDTGKRSFNIMESGLKSVGKLAGFVGSALAGITVAGLALYKHQGNDILQRYRASKMAGTTPGKLAAMETAFRPVLPNSTAMVGQFSAAYMNPQINAAMADVGVQGWQKMSKLQAMTAVLNRAKQISDKTPTDLLDTMAQARMLTTLGISGGTLRALKHTSWKQMRYMETEARTAAPAMNFSKKTGRTMSNLAVDIQQKELQVSTDISRVMAKGANTVRHAINRLANALQGGVNTINHILESAHPKKALEKYLSKQLTIATKHVTIDVIKGADNALFGGIGENKQFRHSMVSGYLHNSGRQKEIAILKASVASDRKAMIAAKGGDIPFYSHWRYEHLRKIYEATKGKLAALTSAPTGHSTWQKSHNPFGMRPFAGDQEAQFYVPRDHDWQNYASFRTWGQAFRTGARTIRGYHKDTLAGIMKRWEGKTPSAGEIQPAMRESGISNANQRINLNNPQVMARVLAGISASEEPMNGVFGSSQNLIAAIERGLSKMKIYVQPTDSPYSMRPQIHAAGH